MRKDRNRLYAVFSLIKVFNRKEKQLYKYLESFKKTDANHTILYQQLEKQKEFNEPTLLTQMFELGFEEKQVKDLGSYLFNQLIRVLRYYGKAPNSDIYLLLETIEVLENIEALHQVLKVIKIAKEKASERELFGIEAQLIQKEISLLTSGHFRSQGFKQVKGSTDRLQELAGLMTEKAQFVRLYAHALELLERKWELENDREESETKEVLVAKLSNHELINRSVKSKASLLFQLSIVQIVNQLKRDKKSFVKDGMRILAFFSENPHFKSTSPSIFLRTLYQLGLIGIEIGNWDLFKKIISLTHAFPAKTLVSKAEKSFYLLYLAYFHKWETNREVLGVDTSELAAYCQTHFDILLPNQQILISLFSSAFHLGIENAKQSLKWIHLLHEQKLNLLGKREHFISRLLQIIGMVQNGSLALAHSKISRLQNWLYRQGINPNGWKELKKFLLRLCDSYSHSDTQKSSTSFLRAGKNHWNDIKKLCHPFDIELYARSLEKGKTMLETKFLSSL